MKIINQFFLAGKTALVTGSKRGIGQVMALALAEAGADSIGVRRCERTRIAAIPSSPVFRAAAGDVPMI